MAETVPAYTVAAMFLRHLGAPVTPAMQRAVAIWLRFESGGTIRGNNPWNLHSGAACPQSQGYCPGNGSLPGQIGNRYAGPGDRNVAVFRTLDDGVKASANNLIRLSPNYGYGKVIAEARQGDALGFLVALQNSSWSAGHYSYSKLVSAFRGSFNYNTALVLSPVGGGSSTVPPGSDIGDKLGDNIEAAWSHLVAAGFPRDPNYVFKAEDFDKFFAAYVHSGLPNNDTTRNAMRRIFLEKWVGKTLGSFVQLGAEQNTSRQDNFFDQAAETLATVGDVLGFLVDPQNWLYVLALAGGVVLAGYGFAQLTGARPSLPGVSSVVE